MQTSRIVGLAFALIAMFVAGPVSAYCRTTTCDPNSQDCTPADGEECTSVGMPLYWPNSCVGYNLQQDAAPTIPFDTFASVAQRAFDSWTSADCGGQSPSIEVHYLGPISCGAAEYNQYAGNANIVSFRSKEWPYKSSLHTLALTTVTFNTENAHIYDVDIEINAANAQLTTGDSDVQYDLEAILTHEIGHYFGLAHSQHPSATMNARYKRGTTDLRTLEQDDVNGICVAYPAGRKEDSTCNPTPRRGLQTTCGDGHPPEDGGCAVTAVGHSTAGSAAALWVLVCLVFVRRRLISS